MLDKASSFWKFLDDLHANDPTAYSDFMQKIMANKGRNSNHNSNPIHKSKIKLDRRASSQDIKAKLIWDEFDKNIECAKQKLFDAKYLNENNKNKNKNKNLNKNIKHRIKNENNLIESNMMEPQLFTPMPFMVIKTKISESKDVVSTLLNMNDYRNLVQKGHKLYVNFLKSPYCKPLKSKSNPSSKVIDTTPICDILVPIKVSQLLIENVDEKLWRCDIIYHDTIYQRIETENNSSKIFKKWIIEFAFRQIEQRNSFKISREYKILKTKKFYGKNPPTPQFAAIRKNNQKKKKQKQEQEDIMDNKINNNHNDNNKKQNEDDLKDNIIFKEKDEEKEDGNMIKEAKKYLIPKYKMNVIDSEKKIKITIELDKEDDIKDLDLEMNDCLLRLKSNNYKLDIDFPHKVDEKSVKAKFDKNKRCLKLKLQMKQ